MASPGMMQSGLSRELFEDWCTDKKNGCIIAGYCVEGTLAKVCIIFVAKHTSYFSKNNKIRVALLTILFKFCNC